MHNCKSMKTAYLHLGFHKTGTTSFQNECFNSANLLIEQDTVYPLLHNFHDSRCVLQNHSIPVLTAYASNPQQYPKGLGKSISKSFALKKDYRNDFIRALGVNEDIIISGEDISALSNQDLLELRDEIQSYGFKINVIVIVRSPYSFYCSVVQESINNGNRFWDIMKPGIDRRSHYIEKLINVFEGQVSFYSFDDAKKHVHGPSGFLAEAMKKKINHVHSSSGAATNKGANNLRTRVKNALNSKNEYLGCKWKSEEIAQLLNKIDDAQPFLLSEEELAIKARHFEAENRKIEKLLGIQFCDKVMPTAADLNFNAISEIIAAILRAA